MADSTKPKKNYVKGSAKEVTFSNGGSLINLDLKVEGKLFGSNGEILPNKGGYVKLTLSPLSKPDDYGNTHTIFENEFKPDASKPKASPAKAAISGSPRSKATASFSTDSDLPF